MWPDATQTQELLLLAGKGDADAVDRLLARHREPVRRMIDLRLDPEQTPASAAIQQELQKRLHEALGRLDDDDREVILMRHFEQLANQEVAAALGLTEAAASMRYLRAVRRLRDLLAPPSAS